MEIDEISYCFLESNVLVYHITTCILGKSVCILSIFNRYAMMNTIIRPSYCFHNISCTFFNKYNDIFKRRIILP